MSASFVVVRIIDVHAHVHVYAYLHTCVHLPTFFVPFYGRTHGHLCNLMLSPIYISMSHTYTCTCVYIICFVNRRASESQLVDILCIRL